MKNTFSRHVSYSNSGNQKQTTRFPNCIDATSQNLAMMDESVAFFVSASTGCLVLSMPKRHNGNTKTKTSKHLSIMCSTRSEIPVTQHNKNTRDGRAELTPKNNYKRPTKRN